MSYLKLLLVATVLLIGCSSIDGDPLKNTKKLVFEGHADLYTNGALQVPYTKVKLIAAGPKTWDLVNNLSGIKARESLLLALANLQDTYGLIKAGTLKSWNLSKEIYSGTKRASKKAHKSVVDDSFYLIKKSANLPKELTLKSIKYSRETTKKLRDLAKRIDEGARDFGEESKKSFLFKTSSLAVNINKSSDDTADRLIESSENRNKSTISKQLFVNADKADESAKKIAKSVYGSTSRLVKEHFAFAKKGFIQGYMAFYPNVKERVRGYSLDGFADYFKESNEIRKKYSDKMSYIFKSSIKEYSDDVARSLNRAKNAITSESSSIGITFGAVKALTWLTKALLWDATVKPVGKVGIGALGYVAVNSIVYPTMLVSLGGVAVSEIAVKLVWDSTMTVYDLTAPTFIATFASALSLSEKLAGLSLAGATRVVGKGFKYGLKTAGATSYASFYIGGKVKKYGLKTTSYLVKGSGVVASSVVKAGGYLGGNIVEHTSKGVGKIASLTVRYIGVPIAATTIPVTGATVGVVTGGAGIATAAMYLATGETVAGGSYVFGTTLAGATTVVGTTGSVAVASGLAVYEAMKGVAVPSSYMMGAGVVLTYGNLTQLGAQTILAASDAAYLVLSLEGPRWVLYAVKGKLNDGSSLNGGTILDLEKMQQRGEEFEYIPADREQIKKVLDSFKK